MLRLLNSSMKIHRKLLQLLQGRTNRLIRAWRILEAC